MIARFIASEPHAIPPIYPRVFNNYQNNSCIYHFTKISWMRGIDPDAINRVPTRTEILKGARAGDLLLSEIYKMNQSD